MMFYYSLLTMSILILLRKKPSRKETFAIFANFGQIRESYFREKILQRLIRESFFSRKKYEQQ